ncbi:hypothetical protein EKH55_1980 [Sinorhizobium alkalisoli]|nr:hypothetical protein EKH55_1980 [Sinorhizobium alkalisoli]
MQGESLTLFRPLGAWAVALAEPLLGLMSRWIQSLAELLERKYR